jgi:GTP-binding protein HflX
LSSEHFIDRHKGGENAYLVHINLDNENVYAEEEFRELALSAGANIVGEESLRRSVAHPKYLLGTGQAERIVENIKDKDVDVVLINHALSPRQERNLEGLFNTKVIGRTGLILDIFASRAQTYEGKLQVELAQLQHLSTRLVRGWTHLERQKGGIGLRGPGETQLETDRRLLSDKINLINKRLEKVATRREQNRRARTREQLPTVALVGYTNAGKSTLFNTLSSADVYVQDQLFATLDPTVRNVKIGPIGQVLIADTVGFIQDLPHELVAAFKSTLEETKQADLLLHVIDSSDPLYKKNIAQVVQVLKEIGADTLPRLSVFNKIDISDLPVRTDRDEDDLICRTYVSAKTGAGIPELKDAIAELLVDSFVYCSWRLPPTAGAFRAKLYEVEAVLSEVIDDDGFYCLELQLPHDAYAKLWREYQELS